jgi:hypothetical protein
METLLSVISPKEAQAEIVGDRESMALVRAIYKAAEEKELKGDYLSKMYRKIISAADRHPETVSIRQAKGLSDVYNSVGDYNPGTKTIFLDQQYGVDDMSNVVPHELLHFLSSVTYGERPVDEQHSFIKSVLGTDVFKPASELEGYKEPTLTKEQSDMLMKMIGQ